MFMKEKIPQADREGYPEVAEAFKRYAWEEAEHAAKFAELLGEIVWDTKTNVKKRMEAECGACEGKLAIAKRAKALGYDAIMTPSTKWPRTKPATVPASRAFGNVSSRSNQSRNIPVRTCAATSAPLTAARMASPNSVAYPGPRPVMMRPLVCVPAAV